MERGAAEKPVFVDMQCGNSAMPACVAASEWVYVGGSPVVPEDEVTALCGCGVLLQDLSKNTAIDQGTVWKQVKESPAQIGLKVISEIVLQMAV